MKTLIVYTVAIVFFWSCIALCDTYPQGNIIQLNGDCSNKLQSAGNYDNISNRSPFAYGNVDSISGEVCCISGNVCFVKGPYDEMVENSSAQFRSTLVDIIFAVRSAKHTEEMINLQEKMTRWQCFFLGIAIIALVCRMCVIPSGNKCHISLTVVPILFFSLSLVAGTIAIWSGRQSIKSPPTIENFKLVK